MSEPFDFNRVLAALQNGQDLTGKDGILTPLVKQLTECRYYHPRRTKASLGSENLVHEIG